MNLADLRTQYRRRGLEREREDLAAEPIAQFDAWMAEANASWMHELSAMSLAAVGVDGCPLLSTVLFKRVDPCGFVAFTNLVSRKAAISR